MKKVNSLVTVFISCLLFLSNTVSVSAFAPDFRVHYDGNFVIGYSNTAQKGTAINAKYNNSQFDVASMEELDMGAYVPAKLDANALNSGDKIFFLDENYAPINRAFVIPQAEANSTIHIDCTLQGANVTQGADVYIDGVRYEEDITPCDVPVNAGTHFLEIKVPGYKTYSETVSVSAGEPLCCSVILQPDIPEYAAEYIITVNMGDGDARENLYDYQMNFNDETITFPEAVQLVQSDKEHSYCIRFDESVTTVTCGEYANLEINADNLTIDGITGRTKPVILDFKNPANQKYILIRPCDNFTLYGVEINQHNVLSIRPMDNTSGPESYHNTKVLGCTFKNADLLPFGGACKFAGVSGRTDYTDFYICGNILDNSYTFYAYSGDTDNSVTDGLYMCANTLVNGGYVTVNCADCNTWYIYGKENTEAAGATPFTSDGNTVRNVLVSGNQGAGKTGEGFFTMAVGIFGDSNNTIENVTIRNNYFANNIHVRAAQVGDHQNVGNTITTSGNTLKNVELAFNKLDDYTGWEYGSTIYLHTVTYENDMNSQTVFYNDNNSLENIVFHHNVYTGKNQIGYANLQSDIGYSDFGSEDRIIGIPLSIGNVSSPPEGVTIVSAINNTASGIYFFANSKASKE